MSDLPVGPPTPPSSFAELFAALTALQIALETLDLELRSVAHRMRETGAVLQQVRDALRQETEHVPPV